jgi:hypothetical protein
MARDRLCLAGLFIVQIWQGGGLDPVGCWPPMALAPRLFLTPHAAHSGPALPDVLTFFFAIF